MRDEWRGEEHGSGEEGVGGHGDGSLVCRTGQFSLGGGSSAVNTSCSANSCSVELGKRCSAVCERKLGRSADPASRSWRVRCCSEPEHRGAGARRVAEHGLKKQE